MPIFPYDDDERRRRMAEQGLTDNSPRVGLPPAPAPTLPNIPMPRRRPIPRPTGIPGGIEPPGMPGAPPPSSLPELVTPRPPLSSPGIPGGTPGAMRGPTMAVPEPTRYEDVQAAKEAFLQKTPGRFKSAGLGALRSFLGGGGLVGAAMGAAGGAIDPRGLQEQEFNRKIRPQIYERFGFEDQDRAMQVAAVKAAAERAVQQAQIANIGSEIRSREDTSALNNRKQVFAEGQPLNVPKGATAIDRRTGRPIYTSVDPAQGAMTADQANAALTSEQGTVEEVSRGSLQGRIEGLKQRLTPNEQRLVFGGATRDDSPAAIAAAQARWQKIQDDELNSIRRDTGERRKTEATQRRYGRKGTPGRTTISKIESENLLH